MYYIPKHANASETFQQRNAQQTIIRSSMRDCLIMCLQNCAEIKILTGLCGLLHSGLTQTPRLPSFRYTVKHQTATIASSDFVVHILMFLLKKNAWKKKEQHQQNHNHLMRGKEGTGQTGHNTKKKTLSLTLNCPLGKCIESLRSRKDHWPSGWTLFWPCLAGQG